jgi:hypothetical protein
MVSLQMKQMLFVDVDQSTSGVRISGPASRNQTVATPWTRFPCSYMCPPPLESEILVQLTHARRYSYPLIINELDSKCVNVSITVPTATILSTATIPSSAIIHTASATIPTRPFCLLEQYPYFTAPLEASCLLGITLEHVNSMTNRRRTNGYKSRTYSRSISQPLPTGCSICADMVWQYEQEQRNTPLLSSLTSHHDSPGPCDTPSLS